MCFNSTILPTPLVEFQDLKKNAKTKKQNLKLYKTSLNEFSMWLFHRDFFLADVLFVHHLAPEVLSYPPSRGLLGCPGNLGTFFGEIPLENDTVPKLSVDPCDNCIFYTVHETH